MPPRKSSKKLAQKSKSNKRVCCIQAGDEVTGLNHRPKRIYSYKFRFRTRKLVATASFSAECGGLALCRLYKTVWLSRWTID
jgi:hypothetical protein